MYAGTGSDGKRRYTVAEIAGAFAVSRKTIYRHLDNCADVAVMPKAGLGGGVSAGWGGGLAA